MKLSPSAAPRAALCPPSVTLPQSPVPSGPAALRGTEMHARLARAVQAGENPVPGLPWHLERHVEVAMAYDTTTGRGRILGYDLGRNYPTVAETELKGSADLVLLGDNRAVVCDWKTGRRREGPAQHWQVRLYALMVAAAFGVSEVEGVLAWLDHDVLDRWTFDALELAATAAELRALLGRIAQAERGELEPTPGEHCQWCPAKPACPKYGGAVAELAARAWTPDEWKQQAQAALATPEGAARVYELKQLAEGVADVLGQVLKDNAPVVMPGRTLRLVPQQRANLSANKLAESLRTRFPAEAEAMIAAATMTTEFTTLRQEKNT